MGILNYLIIFLLLIFPIAELGKIQLGAVSFSLNDIAFLTVATVWVIVDYKKINRIKFNLLKPILLFSAVGLFPLLINSLSLTPNSFFVSLLYLVRWVLYSSIYFVLMTRDKKFLEQFKYLLVIPISLFLLIGFVQFFYYPSLANLFYLGWDEHLYRLFSSFLDPNFAGTFFVITFLYLSYLSWETYKKKKTNKTILLSIISLINLITIYLTYSRSALIMLLVSTTTFLVLTKKLKLVGFVLAALILFIFISPKSFQTEGTNLLRIASGQARIESANDALKIISQNPVFGVGFNAYRYAQYKYTNLTDAKWETTHSGAGTDNSFLFVLATTGVVGFVIYIYLLYRIFILGRDKSKNPVSIVLISVLAGLLVNSFFINSLFYVYILEWIWILAALTEATENN
ncbi:MAG: O-antigen ligase family protein [Candidatus Levybacteria bacterium]|nr:O-antigen ligase family protein [Candidatus Levybacteria bacterium]